MRPHTRRRSEVDRRSAASVLPGARQESRRHFCQRPARHDPWNGGDNAAAVARDELVAACDGFLIREAIAASLTADERREILRGMILTRAVDNRLKQFFLSGEIKFDDVPFQGKGFRSLGQEADLRCRHPAETRRAVA